MDPADFTLNVAGNFSVTNLAGVGRLTMQGGGTLTLTDDVSNLADRPIKADGIGFTVAGNATLQYNNASNSIPGGFVLGGSTGEIILDNGTLDVTGAIGTAPDMLAHYGWNHLTESELHFLDGSAGQSLMTMTPDNMGAPLTNGPGGRGLWFNNDADYRATGAITQDDNYMNLWVGKLHVADTELNQDFMLRVNADDDFTSIWLDKSNDGVFQAGEQIAWSPLSAQDHNAKTFQFTAAGDYMVAFTHGEGGGGSTAQFLYKAPGMAAEKYIRPAVQPGRWLGIGPEAVDITNDVIVSGNSTIRLTGLGTPSLAWVGLNDGANLTLESSLGIDVETIEALEGGEVTLTSDKDVNMSYYADSADLVTINKAGSGVLNLGSLPGTPNSGPNTTLRIQEGTFRPASQEALGSAVDGFMSLDLAGGTLDILGVAKRDAEHRRPERRQAFRQHG